MHDGDAVHGQIMRDNLCRAALRFRRGNQQRVCADFAQGQHGQSCQLLGGVGGLLPRGQLLVLHTQRFLVRVRPRGLNRLQTLRFLRAEFVALRVGRHGADDAHRAFIQQKF